MLHSRAHEIDDFGPDLVEAVLDTVTALARPDALALYALESDAWRLVRADGATRTDLDMPLRLSESERRALQGGMPVVLKRRPPVFIMPAAVGGRLAGVLALRPVPGLSHLPRMHVPTLVALLARGLDELGRRAGSVASGEDELTGEDAAERETLVALLVANEWNVARVARLLGVTRTTVYNRIRRLKVPRERVRKSKPRRGRAGSQD